MKHSINLVYLLCCIISGPFFISITATYNLSFFIYQIYRDFAGLNF